jgi:hypothetical protein
MYMGPALEMKEEYRVLSIFDKFCITSCHESARHVDKWLSEPAQYDKRQTVTVR